MRSINGKRDRNPLQPFAVDIATECHNREPNESDNPKSMFGHAIYDTCRTFGKSTAGPFVSTVETSREQRSIALPWSGIAWRSCSNTAAVSAICEASGEQVASGDLGGGANQRACGIEDQSIAAIEDGER